MSKFKNSIVLIITLLTIFWLFSASTALADSAYNSAAPFNDTKANHWGFKDIIRMNIRGVVKGYNDGSFQPDKPVSQIEAVIMAVHNMGVTSELANIDSDQPLPVFVPAWAEKGNKKEILYALQKGMIVPSEGRFDATANASRAWVTQLMVRMINKDQEAAQTTQMSSVQDTASISEWAQGYVYVAQKYNLISGYPDNTFKPNRDVNRAEMVALLSRSEQFLNLSQTVYKVKVVSLEGQDLKVLVNGLEKILKVDSETWFFDLSGKFTTWSVLQGQNPMSLIVNGSTVKYMEALSPDTSLYTISGSVLQVLPEDKILVIQDEQQKIYTYSLSQFATVSAQSGNLNELSQVTPGDEVEIGVNAMDEANTVLVLNGISTLPDSSGSSVIYSINPVQKLIVLKNPNGKFNSYQYSDQVSVKVPNQRFAVITDLQIGDEVKIKLTADIITEIELVSASEQTTASGKVILLSLDKRIITIQKEKGALESFPIASIVEVNIDGSNNPQLANILANDDVQLTIDNGSVIAITVQGRNEDTLVSGTVAAIDTNNRVITFKPENEDTLKVYDFSSGVQVIIDGDDSKRLSDLRKDMKVEMKIINNKVVYIKYKNYARGSVVSIDKIHHILTLKLDGTTSPKSYNMADPVTVIIEGVTSPDLDDIKIQDAVEVRLENDLVTKISFRKIISYVITNTYQNSPEIRVKDGGDSIKYLNITPQVIITIPEVSSANLDDLSVGDVINATFFGKTLTEIEVVPVNRGIVTSINSASKTITVKSFEGDMTTYTFSNASEIINGTQTSNLLSALSVGNRVEVKDLDVSAKGFNIMQEISGQFLSSGDGKVSVSKEDPTNWYAYTLSPSVYIHKGTYTITLESITRNTSVDLYLLHGLVYELEKK